MPSRRGALRASRRSGGRDREPRSSIDPAWRSSGWLVVPSFQEALTNVPGTPRSLCPNPRWSRVIHGNPPRRAGVASARIPLGDAAWCPPSSCSLHEHNRETAPAPGRISDCGPSVSGVRSAHVRVSPARRPRRGRGPRRADEAPKARLWPAANVAVQRRALADDRLRRPRRLSLGSLEVGARSSDWADRGAG